jgi:hypothetical protein
VKEFERNPLISLGGNEKFLEAVLRAFAYHKKGFDKKEELLREIKAKPEYYEAFIEALEKIEYVDPVYSELLSFLKDLKIDF